MKITVLGAGAIGRAVAYALCQRDEVSRVQVCEARPAVLRALRQKQSHPALRTYEADARDIQTLEPILSGSACIISCMDPSFNPYLAQVALRLGAHFLDLGGPPEIIEQIQDIKREAEERQRWVMFNNGLAPGLVNVLCMRGIEAFDEPCAARIRVGDVPIEPAEPFGYRLAHSAEKLIEDYTEPVTVLRDGRRETRTPLTGLEKLTVEGFGEMEAFYAAGGLTTLARSLENRLERLDTKALRYPGHADRMRFLIDLGFADQTVLDVRTHLTYRDVLTRRLRQRLGGDYRDAVIVRVEIEGRVEGNLRRLIYQLIDRYDAEHDVSAMQRCTGLPVAITATLLAQHLVPGGGVAPPEQILPLDSFFEQLKSSGLNVVETWHAHSETPVGIIS